MVRTARCEGCAFRGTGRCDAREFDQFLSRLSRAALGRRTAAQRGGRAPPDAGGMAGRARDPTARDWHTAAACADILAVAAAALGRACLGQYLARTRSCRIRVVRDARWGGER